MKLINPTDNELDAAFAEHVAGWTHVYLGGPGYVWKHPRPSDGELSIYPLERFTAYADAVLPYLEKCRYITTATFVPTQQKWCVGIGGDSGTASIFARAAVIALLRAHKVEVEFTNAQPN